MRLLSLAIALLVAITAQAQQNGQFETDKAEAFQLFHQGKVRQAVRKFQATIPQAPDVAQRIALQRDLLEACAVAYDWACVGKTIQQMMPSIQAQADQQLRYIFFPEVVLYELKMKLGTNNDAYVDQLIQQGAPFNITNTASHPTAIAEFQLALLTHEVERNRIPRAEDRLSSAIFGLLLSDPKNTYAIGKLVVQLIEGLLEAQDVVGALALAAQTHDFLLKTLARDGVLYTRHQMNVAQLLSFMNNNALTASAFTGAISLLERLDIDEEMKAYQLATANNLGVASLVLAGKMDEAQALHARHPAQTKKVAIFQRGEFQSYEDFFFGVTNVFLDAASSKKPDERWKKLFENLPKWRLTDLQQTDLNSYRNFVLGVLNLSGVNEEEGQAQLVLAASQRIDNFEKVLRANFEAFQFPGIVDKIVIAVGLNSCCKKEGRTREHQCGHTWQRGARSQSAAPIGRCRCPLVLSDRCHSALACRDMIGAGG